MTSYGTTVLTCDGWEHGQLHGLGKELHEVVMVLLYCPHL